MRTETVKSEFLNEEYRYFKHKSGLDVYVFPKEMSTSYALFATKYGSIDNKFKVSGEDGFTTVPNGIAHFLEHKMFENENGEDTFVRYARTGANANAYTSNSMTAYLFSCTENLYESLEILLDFVTKPYFTKETVEKEQGIIAQEIRMYDDNPGSRLYYELLGAMYREHNVKINVAGTVDSIREITPELLYSCYNTFYNLNNMALCVCGDVDESRVCEVCDKILEKSPEQEIIREYPEEPAEINKKVAAAHLKVATPIFAIGVKDVEISPDPMVRLKKNAVAEIVCKLLFGKSSALYTELYEKNLISGDLSAEYEHNESFSFLAFDGESDNPDEVYKIYSEHIKKAKLTPPSREEFEIAKRVKLASFIGMFDSTESIANEFLSFIFDGATVFDYVDALKEVTFEDAVDFINGVLKEEYSVLAKILPIEDK